MQAEQAVLQIMDSKTHIKPELFACQIVEHVRSCFGMLRQIIKENIMPELPKKTGGFRRSLSAAETLVINSLLDKMKLSITNDDQNVVRSETPQKLRFYVCMQEV